ncbi:MULTISPECIES: MOSC domain-containing protein [unclassified Roseibium]|uniref:MOSC domain-containing protein n=1 Tax=unclassified Roseibium TaxID=2629323 RepID=UPI00092A4E67|nr:MULTISPECIES: MOSC domain-containing protein [unclassified Roseibium]OJJ09137.1 molybdenum cofactor sulfurase [Alphaproteobacteria bacterium AO1-B]
MADRDTCLADTLDVTRKFKIAGHVEGVFGTPVTEDFQTEPVERLGLTFEGVPGDRHAGFTRKSGGREPWYPRGTEMCNERQISILSLEELAIIAERMEIPELKSEWIGGNITLSGIPNLSLIPPRTRLEFEGGVVIRIDGDNAPCRFAGSAIDRQFPERSGLDLLFPQKARRLRGLVGFVEKPGTIAAGETVTAHIPEQWIYPKA